MSNHKERRNGKYAETTKRSKRTKRYENTVVKSIPNIDGDYTIVSHRDKINKVTSYQVKQGNKILGLYKTKNLAISEAIRLAGNANAARENDRRSENEKQLNTLKEQLQKLNAKIAKGQRDTKTIAQRNILNSEIMALRHEMEQQNPSDLPF